MHAVMAAPKGNLPPIWHLTSRERDTFTEQRKHRLAKSVNRPHLLPDFSTPQTHQQLLRLQQRWQQLKRRELTAQQHNMQLLQQFEEAQDTIREMLALTSAMKTTRMEYEWYLEENSLRWQQQLKEKTAAAQKKRMEKSCTKNAEERVTSSADQPLPPQGSATLPQNIAAPPNPYSSYFDYNQHGSPHLSSMQPSWLVPPQSQRARFPIRVPFQPQGSSLVPLAFLPPNTFPHAHPVQLQHLTSTADDYPPMPRQNPAGSSSLQPECSCSWPGGLSSDSAPWGHVYMGEPPPEMGVAHQAGEDGDISRASESGGRSSHLSQELDIKPVRLSGGLVESSDSSMEWSQVGREKRGSSHCSSSQEASRHSNAVATVTVAQSSKSSRSSTSRSTRSQGQAVGSPRMEVVTKEIHGEDLGSQSTSEELKSLVEEPGSEKAEDQSPDDDKSQSSGEESGSQCEEEESGSVSVKIANCNVDEIQEVESSSSEQCSDGEKDGKDLGDGEDNDNTGEDGKSQADGEQDKRNEDVSERENTTEEDETEAEDDAEEQEGEDDNGKKGSAYSDEEVDEEHMEDRESDEEEQRGDVAGEPDSDNSIVIIPQDSTKRMHIIQEEASEDDEEEEESKTGSSDNVSEDDVEHLLAFQSQEKEIKDLRADEKPKEFSENMEVFQVELDMSDHSSDSDEFDHFYS